jgi:hypothetical protein
VHPFVRIWPFLTKKTLKIFAIKRTMQNKLKIRHLRDQKKSNTTAKCAFRINFKSGEPPLGVGIEPVPPRQPEKKRKKQKNGLRGAARLKL